ncbi:MAG: hypothetical protein DDT31_01380 [Syntrophomonadaceae bacterium]|nr:hypothetical protein [Bacillota bacterium]
MNFSPKDVETLRSILTLCKTVGVDSIVLSGGKVMGAAASKKLAIITDTCFEQLGVITPVGIGRLAELERRLTIFNDSVSISGETGKSGEMTRLTLSSGRSKAQFRCTATSMIKHPKENTDVPLVVVTMTKAEVQQLVKAVKTFTAETIIFKISPAGDVHIECVDSTNDQFTTGTEKAAEFIDETTSAFFTYLASYLTTVLDVGTREADSIDLIFGHAGSITALVKGYLLMIMPNINED